MEKKKESLVKEKTCFVIMPISDMDGYENGHFSRVYNHLVKPACEKAGYVPVRADEVASSNYIVIDILSKIVESDLVICDLSGKNPNVLYELGIRQAFNLPTVLIKDSKTDKIFDIQGLRYAEYNQTLRIDSVEQQVSSIAKSIQETVKAKGADVNSLVQLLGVKSATIPSKIELSGETSVILSAIKDLSSRIISLEQSPKRSQALNINRNMQNYRNSAPITPISKNNYLINGSEFSLGEKLYMHGEQIGRLVDASPEELIVERDNHDMDVISIYSADFNDINDVPF